MSEYDDNIIIIVALVICIFMICMYIYARMPPCRLIRQRVIIDGQITSSSIPKIIHQTAPSDTKRWPKTWFICQQSWKKHYPDFEYKMWSDEDLRQLVKDH